MRIYGIDFTSAPLPPRSRSKPGKCLTCAVADLDECGCTLTINKIYKWVSFRGFVKLLTCEQSWVAAIDFPFGLPKEFLDALSWGNTWAEYVAQVEKAGKECFEKQVRTFGMRLMRRVDELAHSRSPLQLDYIPVCKMFFQGAQRLLRSSVDIVPVRRTDSCAKILEAYPALVGEKCGHRNGYKQDNPRKQNCEQRTARENIVNYLHSDKCLHDYGFRVSNSSLENKMLSDPTGDTLDAVLCAVQSAWGYIHRNENYGLAHDANVLEGWIADPSLLIDRGLGVI